MSSTERLVRALEAASDARLAALLERARQHYYHDYRSPLTFPIRQLAADLSEAGHAELAERALRGEFDATQAEAAEWMSSDEGRETFRELLGQDPPEGM